MVGLTLPCSRCDEIHPDGTPCHTWARPTRSRPAPRATGPLPSALLGSDVDGRYRIQAIQEDHPFYQRLVAQHLGMRRTVSLTWATPDMEPEVQKAWMRRARAAADLDHPNIGRVVDVGEAQGRPFVTSLYADAGNLGRRLVERGLPALPELMDLTHKLLSALSYAHARGVLHRDLRLQMVRICIDGNSERVKLVGFENPADLALPTSPSVDRLLARTPMRFDEPTRGGAEVDVFALAALLYRVGTGASPFAASDADALQQELTRLGPKRSRSVRGELPQAFDLALSEALHRDPGKRLLTVEAFRERLHPPETLAGTRPLRVPDVSRDPL